MPQTVEKLTLFSFSMPGRQPCDSVPVAHATGTLGQKTYAANFFLPFSLLLAKTLRPFFVLILFLKPCSLARCLFLGWYVLSMGIPPCDSII